MKKSIAMLLVGSLVGSTVVGLAGCQIENPNNKIDKDKVQLYVGNYNGGVGDKWLDSVVERFEEKYGLPFPLLSDPEKEVHQAYDVLKEKSKNKTEIEITSVVEELDGYR